MTEQKPEKPPVETLSFEQALQELEGIVRALETGAAPLEDSIEAYERGITLKRHCEAKLRDAKSKIEQISIESDGAVKTAPVKEE